MKYAPLPADFDPTASIVPGPVGDPVSIHQAVSPPSSREDVLRSLEESMSPVTPAAAIPADEETTLFETDARYFGIANDLPTSLGFYPFNKVSVRPFGLAEHFKISAATKGGRIRYLMEAVGATLDRPIMSMALMDFWFVAYWLRTMSYRRNIMTADWSCEHPEHYQQVALGVLPAATLENKSLIERSSLNVNPLDVATLRPISEALGELGIILFPPSVADFVEFVEEAENWDDEYAAIAQYAGLLHTTHGLKLVQRVDFLKKVSGLPNGMEILRLLQDAERVFDKAGVIEDFPGVCKHCGNKTTIALEVDLLTFFPFGD